MSLMIFGNVTKKLLICTLLINIIAASSFHWKKNVSARTKPLSPLQYRGNRASMLNEFPDGTMLQTSDCISKVAIDPVKAIEMFINSSMNAFSSPGLAISIQKGGKSLLSKGFGYRDMNSKLPVTSRTTFAIASCTKAFTSTAIAIAQQKNLVQWNDKVKSLLPFVLADQFANSGMNLVDLVTHRSGLPSNDGLWYNANFTLPEIYQRIQYLQPSKDFRTYFQYKSLEHKFSKVTSRTYEDFVTQEILIPLGMKRTQFSVEKSKVDPDHATPYILVNGKAQPTPFWNLANIVPAGGINSNVEEMSHWTQMHLNKGEFNGKKILPPDVIEYLHTGIMHMPYNDSFNTWFPFLWEMDYGFGWSVAPYRGHKVVFHPGNINGFSSLTVLLPQDNISIVLLVNLDGTYLPFAVAFYAIDILLGFTPGDWSNYYLQLQAQDAQSQQQWWKYIWDSKKNGTLPSHPLSDYAGTYYTNAYGKLTISRSGSSLLATYYVSMDEYTLTHWHYDVFAAVGDESILFFNFQTDNVSGNVVQVDVPMQDGVSPTPFLRM